MVLFADAAARDGVLGSAFFHAQLSRFKPRLRDAPSVECFDVHDIVYRPDAVPRQGCASRVLPSKDDQ